ncbi:hypothetical protein GCM10010321_87080 [Streptomyces chartreusis]|nr:hypothetical protein GCM10010321_87080 [Streptomyces chartreusis]
MSDPAALYALVGALAGAALGAGATVAAPLITGRHARRIQEQVREDAEQEKRRVREEAEFARLMALRRTSREVLLLLDGGRQDAERSAFDSEQFFPALRAAMRDMRDAADALEIDGMRFNHSPSTPEINGLRRRAPETQAMMNLANGVRAMEEMLRASDPQDSIPVRGRSALRDMYLSLETYRYGLIGVLAVRMEELRGGPDDGFPRDLRTRRSSETSDPSVSRSFPSAGT